MWVDLDIELAEIFGDLRVPNKLKAEGLHVVGHKHDGAAESKASYSVPTSLRIFELYSAGQTMKETSAKTGVSEEAIRRLLHKVGVPIRKSGPRQKVDRERVRQLKADGKTNADIARELGVTKEAIGQIVRKK